MRPLLLVGLIILMGSCGQKPVREFDTIIRGGTIYDGSGDNPFPADIGINADTIAEIGDLLRDHGKIEIDASGLAVSPGFINMLSWADESLIKDGRSMSDIMQGVTLEVFGEGWSPGPVKRKNKQEEDSLWTTLGEYFDFLIARGITPNVASLVGATTVRIYEIGFDNRPPTPEELDRMKEAVGKAMEDGVMGLGTSLIYAPANFATTDELVQLAKVASSYGGIYMTHMRSEGDAIYSALDETFKIAREANIRTEIYHLKLSHERNWHKIDTVLTKIDSARNAGLKITANMYPYAASATGLTARIPAWVQEGGAPKMRRKLKDPAIRKRVLQEMREGFPSKNSDPHDVMILGFRKDTLNKLYKGKRLDEVAKLYGKDPDETLLDLVMEDKSAVPAVYFLISENNVSRMLKLPYVSIGSDAASFPAEEPFIKDGTHPRAYGTFARFLGRYVIGEKLITLQEGIRRMTSLPASNLKIEKRGLIKSGYYADIAIFDSTRILDHATFENPHVYSSGMIHVLVNGTFVLKDGFHTNARPGRIIRGPGWSVTNVQAAGND